MPTPVPVEGERLLQEITKQVFIVVLHCGWPKLKYQISDAIVAVAGNDEQSTEIAAEFRTNPQWDLLPSSWAKRLGNLESRIRSALSSASVQFAVARGMAVLPVSRAAEVFNNLRMLRTEMETARDEFVAEYEQILATLREQLGDELYNKAAKKLPSANEIAAKFIVVWGIVPCGNRANVADADLQILERALTEAEGFCESNNKREPREYEQARAVIQRLRGEREISQITDEQAAEVINEAREQMQQFTRELLEDMAREPRQMLMQAADNLIEALSDQNRVIRNGTIDQVQRAFQMVEGFAFLAGPELMARIDECRARLNGATPQMLNSDAQIGSALAAGLRGVRDAAADAQAASEAMRQFRGVRIRKKKEEAQ